MLKDWFREFVNQAPRKYVCGPDSIEFLHVDAGGYVNVKHIGWQRNSMCGADPLYGLGEFELNSIVFESDDFTCDIYLKIRVISKWNIEITHDYHDAGERKGRIFALVE